MLKYLLFLIGLLGFSSLVYANCEIDSDLLNRSCSNEYFSPKNIKHLNDYLQHGKFKDGKLLNLELDFDIKDKEIKIATWCDVKVNRGVSFKSSLNGICILGANVILEGENQLNSDKKSPIVIGAGRSITLRRSHLQTQGVIALNTKNFNPFDGEILISKDSTLRADKINISTPSSLIINRDSSLKSSENILNGGNCEVGDYDDSENDEDRDHGRSCKRFSPKFQYSGKCATNPLPTNIKILSSLNGQDLLNINYSLENRPASTEVRWRFDQEVINLGTNSNKNFLFPGRHLVESIVVDQSGYFRKIGTYQNISPNKFNKGQTAIFQFSGLKRSSSKVTALMGLRKFTLLRSEQNPELYSGEIPADSAGNKLMAIPEFGYKGSFNLVVLPAISNPDEYISQSVDQLSILLDSVTSTNQSYLNSKASLQSLLEELKTKIAVLSSSDKQKVAEYLQANIFADLQGVTSFNQIKSRPSTLFGLLIASAYADEVSDFIKSVTNDMYSLVLSSPKLIGAGFVAIGLIGVNKLPGWWKTAGVASILTGLALLISKAQGAQDLMNNVHAIDTDSIFVKLPSKINSGEATTFSVWGKAVPIESIAPNTTLISQVINSKVNLNNQLVEINSQVASLNSTLSLLGFSSQVESLPLLSFPQTTFPTVLSTNYITNVQLISSEDGQASIKNFSKNGNNLLITFNSSRTQNAKLRVTFVNADLGINKNIDTDIAISVAPKAVINYTKNNLVVNFDSTDPEDPNVTGLTYSWNFGDGQTVNTTSKTISHNYLVSGIYNVTLTVTDSYGASDSKTVNISVLGGDSSVTFCNAGLLGNVMNFYIDGVEPFSLQHIFPASGDNYDPHTCECKTIQIPKNQSFNMYIDGTNFTAITLALTPYNGTISGYDHNEPFSTSAGVVDGVFQIGVYRGIYAVDRCGIIINK